VKMIQEIEATLEELDKVAWAIDTLLSSHAIVFLRGDLASGKTTLTQALSKFKGVEASVTSPTFALQQCYEGDISLYHYDLYRLDHEAFMHMGLFEEFEKEGWHIVEWGSEALKDFLESVGYRVLVIDICPIKNTRIYRIQT